MRAGLLLLALAVALPGCKRKKPSYDRSTPEKTLRSLENAFEKGRIPSDLETFFVSQSDVSGWKLRCKDGKCQKARFANLEEVSKDEYTARYLVDVTVFGRQLNERIMVSARTPIKFLFEDGAWFIEELGEYKRIPLKSRKLPPRAPEPPEPATPVDGGP
jgi:hypothetical protein